MEYETQPLDKILNELGLSNAQVVKASTEQLSHKMVQKGRKGRRLTARVQTKILRALNALHPEPPFRLDQLFNYSS